MKDDRAGGYLLLLYLVYTVAGYIYDKFRTAYYLVLDFYSQNNDTIYWLIIAVFAACFLYLCGYLGRKKKKELEANNNLESSDKSEERLKAISNLEMGQIPRIEPSIELKNEPQIEAPSYRMDSIKAVSYKQPEIAELTTNMVQSHEVASDALNGDLEALKHTQAPSTLAGTVSSLKPKYDIESEIESKYDATTNFYRSPSWIKLAKEIRKRDNYTCKICGKFGPNDGVKLHVHHIKPRGIGGSDDPSNLITLCLDCHSMQPHHQHLKNN